MMTARFTTFSSSRTLPGHRYCSIAAIASGSRFIAPRFCPAANLCTKACASSTASPMRSRSGGAVITISASR
jgi:hypothetical protein